MMLGTAHAIAEKAISIYLSLAKDLKLSEC